MRNSLFAAMILAAALTAGQAWADDYTARLTGGAEVPSVTTPGHRLGEDLARPQDQEAGVDDHLRQAVRPGDRRPTSTAPPAPAPTPRRSSTCTPLASPISGRRALTDAQIADLKEGRWYINIHTAQNPKGEIRGQVVHPH